MESCWETGGPDWLFTLVLAGIPVGLFLLSMWWDVRTGLSDKGDQNERRGDPDGAEKDGQRDGGQPPSKWRMAWLALLLAIPIVVVFIDRSAALSLFAWGPGALAVVAALAFGAFHRRTARPTRWLLLLLWIGSLAAGVGALVAMFRLGHPC